jgi:hypothetical protein
MSFSLAALAIVGAAGQRRRFEVPALLAASSQQELQIEKRHWHQILASAP